MDSQRPEKDQPEELKNKLIGINYKQYFKQVPPLADLEKTYNLIETYTNFKENRDESIYKNQWSETFISIESIADSVIDELYKMALVQCNICMEFLLGKILDDILYGLDKHWVESLKDKYKASITGNAKPGNYANLIDLIFDCAFNSGLYGFKNISAISEDEEKKGLSNQRKDFRKEISEELYKYINVSDFYILTSATAGKVNNGGKGSKSLEEELMVIKSMHTNIINVRNDISHGNNHGVVRDYAQKSIEFTVRFSCGFLEKMKNHNILK